MKKKILLGAILILNGFLLGIKKDRDFNRDEIKHALDLMTDKKYTHNWSKWLSRNTENQIKSSAFTKMITLFCNQEHDLMYDFDPEGYRTIRKCCNIHLKFLDDHIIQPLKRLDNREEAKDLIKTLEEKRDYHRADL